MLQVAIASDTAAAVLLFGIIDKYHIIINSKNIKITIAKAAGFMVK